MNALTQKKSNEQLQIRKSPVLQMYQQYAVSLCQVYSGFKSLL